MSLRLFTGAFTRRVYSHTAPYTGQAVQGSRGREQSGKGRTGIRETGKSKNPGDRNSGEHKMRNTREHSAGKSATKGKDELARNPGDTATLNTRD